MLPHVNLSLHEEERHPNEWRDPGYLDLGMQIPVRVAGVFEGGVDADGVGVDARDA